MQGDNVVWGICISVDWVLKRIVEAVKWYRKAADQEYGRALFNLGVMYETGVGVGKDKDMAKVLYEKAVEQGFEQATKG